MSQDGNLPQVGMKIPKICELPPPFACHSNNFPLQKNDATHLRMAELETRELLEMGLLTKISA